MADMFASCTGLTSLDLTNFDTSNVKYMKQMFNNCSSLKILNISNFNTSNVYEMFDMFNKCSSITILDLSSFDTRRVYDMCYMFKGCESLTTIYVETNWITANATKSIYMFLDCKLLVGSAGTKYDATKTDKTYARIDGGESAPGYFTLKTV